MAVSLARAFRTSCTFENAAISRNLPSHNLVLRPSATLTSCSYSTSGPTRDTTLGHLSLWEIAIGSFYSLPTLMFLEHAIHKGHQLLHFGVYLYSEPFPR